MTSGATGLAGIEILHTELTAAYLEFHGVLPLGIADGCLKVGTWVNPPDPQCLDDLAILSGHPVVLEPMPESEGRAAIRRVYSGEVLSPTELADGEVAVDGLLEREPALDDLVSLANEAPVVKLVSLLLLEGVESRASDLHLEQGREGIRTRFRIDGVLQDATQVPAHLSAAVVSRLKIMAQLDVAERRLPQDGRIRLSLRDREVDVRVSTLPAVHGESLVLRLLDRRSGAMGMEALGMADDTRQRFEEAVTRPHGIVLATGPTGSGKTTTLYAALDRVRTGGEKILTVEDPVEYELPGVTQVAVNDRVGLTFASALRSLLRQDPDIILVGEIRDPETAAIAIHAALTGHLVLSTLHTNDAATGLPRLIDLGVDPYLIAGTVEAVLAQRLVRRTCSDCASRQPATEAEVRALQGDPGEGLTVMRGTGCGRCRGSGYRGRTGLYELLVMEDGIRTALSAGASSRHLRTLAIKGGMSPLLSDGLRLIRSGITTPEEVLRVTAA